jgi:DeoR/GlpR family transcriptional regulator of sugar metabolism
MGKRMLAIERKKKILDIIFEKKSVTVSKLSTLFSVTEETIRRDLKSLEDEGHLKRTHGGAFIDSGVLNDINVLVRETDIVENKRRMAAVCKDLISNGDSVFMDCSTTVLHLCDFIANMRLTVLTNSLKILNRLADCGGIRLISIGGEFCASSCGFVGRAAIQSLGAYYADKAFISCRSVDMAHGLTHSNERQADVYNLILDRAEKIYLMCDHTKLDRVSFIRIGDVSKTDALITDGGLSARWREYLTNEGVTWHEA